MSPKILIAPAELDDAARTYREARAALDPVDSRICGHVPDMPADLRARVATLAELLPRDLDEIRTYISAEADELQRRAALARRAHLPMLLLMAIADAFGLSGVAALDETFGMPPPPPPPEPETERKGGGVHGVLDWAGFIPVVGAGADLLNAGIYAAEGDGEGVAWSVAGAVPFAGDAAKGAKMGRKALKETARHGDDAVGASKAARKAGGTDELLRPGGKPIGDAGTGKGIRIVKGSLDDANAYFEKLVSGGVPHNAADYAGRIYKLPDGSYIGLRETSRSGPPTIDVNRYGAGFTEIKFVP